MRPVWPDSTSNDEGAPIVPSATGTTTRLNSSMSQADGTHNMTDDTRFHDASPLLSISRFHHARHSGLMCGEFPGVVAGHLGIIPTPGVHDAGEIDTVSCQIMGRSNARGVRSDVINGPRVLIGGAPSIEHFADTLNDPRDLLGCDGRLTDRPAGRESPKYYSSLDLCVLQLGLEPRHGLTG